MSQSMMLEASVAAASVLPSGREGQASDLAGGNRQDGQPASRGEIPDPDVAGRASARRRVGPVHDSASAGCQGLAVGREHDRVHPAEVAEAGARLAGANVPERHQTGRTGPDQGLVIRREENEINAPLAARESASPA